jgi:hypothetical protein
MRDLLKLKEIHGIADNLSAHKSAPVQDFLTAHPEGPPALHLTTKALGRTNPAVRQVASRSCCSIAGSPQLNLQYEIQTCVAMGRAVPDSRISTISSQSKI